MRNLGIGSIVRQPRWLRSWFVVALLCSPLAATLRAQDPVEPEPEPQAEQEPVVPEVEVPEAPPEPVDPWLALAPYEPAYRDHAAVVELTRQWTEGSEGRIRSVELPATRGGLAVPAIEWGTPGATPLTERPTVILLGGLDGVSFAGGEAVLRAASGLIQNSTSLPGDLAFVAIPWAAPDGLQRAFDGTSVSGANFARTDEDGDEALDEDGPDDLDGDGFILDMLIEDSTGEWTPARDKRFLAKAGPGDAPRYRLVREGADDDADGLFNEDEIGGVILDRNFPVGWKSRGRGGRMGTWPLSESVARAIADLALARRTVCVLVFQGNHGFVASPGRSADAQWDETVDRASWDWMANELTQANGGSTFTARSLREAHGRERGGAAIDWLFAACGIPAVEIALWGPQIASRPTEANTSNGTEPLDAQFRSESSEETTSVGREASAVDRAWARWLDNSRGGVGFTEWYPIGLEGGGTALLGGWSPRTRLNPPEDELPRVLEGVDRFVEAVVRGFPKLEVVLSETRREGAILHLSASVANLGQLSTGMSTEPQHIDSEFGVRLELALPSGARVLAGTEQVELGTVAGGGKSRVVEWIILAPPGSVVRLTAKSAWTLATELEVRP